MIKGRIAIPEADFGPIPEITDNQRLDSPGLASALDALYQEAKRLNYTTPCRRAPELWDAVGEENPGIRSTAFIGCLGCSVLPQCDIVAIENDKTYPYALEGTIAGVYREN